MSLILSCMLIPKEGKLALLFSNTFKAGTYYWIRQSLCCWWCYLVAELCLTLATSWTTAHQVPLPMAFPRQENCSGLPFPSPRDLPDPGIELTTLRPPALADGFFYH